MPGELQKRYCRWINNERYCDSVWDSWARWVFLAILIAGGFLIFLTFACISSRKRRQRGMQPFMGTGWASNVGPWGKPNNNQPPPQYQYQNPPPQYTPNGGPYYAGYPNNNNQYPGQTSNQQNGIELQQPQNAYRGESVYAPAGPTPQKGS